MSGVNRLPLRGEIQRAALGDLRSGGTKITIEVIHHLAQCAELIEKLGPLTEENAAEQTAHARRTLAPGTLKIGGIEGSGIGNRAVVFGVLT